VRRAGADDDDHEFNDNNHSSSYDDHDAVMVGVGTALAAYSHVALVLHTESRWLRGLIAYRRRALAVRTVILIAAVIGASLYDPRLALIPLLVASSSLRHLARRYGDARRGIDAEEEVAKTLALLPASFTVINDVEFDGFNVDHVVIGPTGIWAIETKSHRGIVEEREDGVWVDGQRLFRDPRRQARGGAAAISRRLQETTGRRYWVEALVCVPMATALSGGSPRVFLVECRHLLSRLRWRQQRLTEQECRRVAESLGPERVPKRSVA